MIKKNQQGIALITSLLMLSALTTISIIAMNTALTDLKISKNMRDIKKAFFTAEAGMRHAITVLDTSHNGFDDELKDGVLDFGPSVVFADGSYEVTLSDNNDGDPNYDSDNTIVITSTGKSHRAGWIIEVMLNKLLIPAKTDGALILYEDEPSINIYGNPSIDGRDWNIPHNFNCSESDCNGELSANPSVAGIFSTEELTQNKYGEGSSLTLSGNPLIQQDGDGIFTNWDWQNLAHHLILMSKNCNAFTNGGTVTGNQILGTRKSPQISVVKKSTQFTGNVRGAGVLIIKETVVFQGAFYFEGFVIIVQHDEDSDCALDVGAGQAMLFGSMVAAGSESATICLKTNAQIKYSSQALSNASHSLSRIKIISWQNKY